MDYEAIVFDTAPTGHTLRLLQFPSTLQSALERVSQGGLGGMISNVMNMFGGGGEGQEGDLMGKLEGMKTIVSKVNEQFKNPELTTFVAVVSPRLRGARRAPPVAPRRDLQARPGDPRGPPAAPLTPPDPL